MSSPPVLLIFGISLLVFYIYVTIRLSAFPLDHHDAVRLMIDLIRCLPPQIRLERLSLVASSAKRKVVWSWNVANVWVPGNPFVE